MRAPHIGLLHQRVGRHCGESALDQTAPLRHHDHMVAQPRDRIHLMLDQQDGDPLGDEAAQVLADLVARASG